MNLTDIYQRQNSDVPRWPWQGFLRVREFLDGRLTVRADMPFAPSDSAHDIRFVLDRVEDLAAGRSPDAECRALPAGLGAALDLRRIGMIGWSKGATATALVMNTDRRVRAGLSFDGPMESAPPATDLDRPFMLLTAEYTRPPSRASPISGHTCADGGSTCTPTARPTGRTATSSG